MTTPMQEKIEELKRRREAVMLGGGADKLEKQRQSGKLTARERIDALVDRGELRREPACSPSTAPRCSAWTGKSMPADGVVTGAASVGGRLVHLASQDFTVAGGSAGEVHSIKVAEIMQQSLKTGSPFVFINDSGGARVQEGIDSLSGYGKVFYTNVMLSGAVPQISLICGPCAGGAAYSPALTDFIIQTRQAQMFITGPQVIKQVTGETVTAEQLGGPEAHMANSGRDPLHRRRRPPRRGAVPEAAELPALQQPGRSAASGRRRQRGSQPGARRRWCRSMARRATTCAK